MKKGLFIWIVLMLFNNQLIAKEAVESDDTLWKTDLELGVQLHPDYDANGVSKGLSKTRAYANIGLDARWISDLDDMNGSVLNIGSNIRFYGTKVNYVNLSAPKSFSDVSDTLEASVYLQYVPDFGRYGLGRGVGSELGVMARLGVLTRDKITPDNDTTNSYGDIGLKYTFFRESPYDKNGVAHSLADGHFGIYYRHYFDKYNNFDDKDRLVVDLKYKVTRGSNFIIGFELNKGKGEDEFFVTVTYRNSLSKLLDFFE